MVNGDSRRSFLMLLQATVVTSLLFLSPSSLVIAKPLSSASHQSSLPRTLGYRGLKQQTLPAPAPAPAVTPQVIETAVEVETQATNDKDDEKDKDETDDTQKDNDNDKDDDIEETQKDKDDATAVDHIEEATQDDDKQNEIVEAEIVEAEIVETEIADTEIANAVIAETEVAEAEIVEAETPEVDEDTEKEQVGKEDANEGELPITTFVAIPDIVLELTVDVDAADAGENYAAMETLIEEYMESLLPSDVMGSNYVSADLQATMSKGIDFGESGGNQFSFTIQGLIEYQADPVPLTEELKDRLVWFFSRWQEQGLFEAFLEKNGIHGAQVTSVYVDSEKVPMSTNADSVNGDTSAGGNADSNTGEGSDGGRSKAGLVVGLLVVVMCMLLATLMLYYNRQLIARECRKGWKGCRVCCKSRRDKRSEKKLERLGWTNNFDEEGSATAPPEDRSQRVAPTFKLPKWLARLQRDKATGAEGLDIVQTEDSSVQCVDVSLSKEPPKRPKWLAWLQRDKAVDAPGLATVPPEKDSSPRVAATFSKEPPKLPKCLAWLQRDKVTTKEEENTSQVLPNVHVVVDSGNEPRQPVGPVSYGISHWDVSKLHSEVTVPHGNHNVPSDEEISPQKTSKSYMSDDDDDAPLDDPIVRYAPPTRCQGRMYKSKHQQPSSPSTVASTPSPRQSRSSAPPVVEDQDSDSYSFAEWADFLTPCLPSVTLFQKESGKLDDMVANISHKSAASRREV